MVFSHITVFALKVKVTRSCLTLQSHGLLPARLLCPWNSPGKNTGVDSHALLQRIFPTQGSNSIQSPCYRQVLYHLSHQGSPIFALFRFLWTNYSSFYTSVNPPCIFNAFQSFWQKYVSSLNTLAYLSLTRV